VAAMGYAPVTASSPSDVVVTVDPSFTAVTPEVRCEGPGGEALELCDGNPLITWTPVAFTNTVWVRFLNRGLLGEALILEIVPGTGTAIARTFVRSEGDGSPPDPPLSCEQARSPRLHMSGTLTTNGVDIANPSATHGHLVLALPGGGRVTIDF